ncbi:uncharacterized protein LOC112590250 [Harpegnathos saltator]|nr:uncharacterized protein LOC112590250 [Harpegnathos saltator]
MDKIFINFNNHVNELDVFENHKYYLIKLIIECYIQILMNYEGKLMSQNIEYIRHQFTKIILFKGMKSAMIVLIMAVFGTGGAADVHRCPKSLLAVHSYIVKGYDRMFSTGSEFRDTVIIRYPIGEQLSNRELNSPLESCSP